VSCRFQIPLHGRTDFVCDPTRPTDKIRNVEIEQTSLRPDKVCALVGHPSGSDRILSETQFYEVWSGLSSGIWILVYGVWVVFFFFSDAILYY